MLWYRQKKMAFCNHFCKEHTEKQNTYIQLQNAVIIIVGGNIYLFCKKH